MKQVEFEELTVSVPSSENFSFAVLRNSEFKRNANANTAARMSGQRNPTLGLSILDDLTGIQVSLAAEPAKSFETLTPIQPSGY
jgi:hypothetical protein